MTVKELIKSSMRKLGVLSAGDDPTPDELQDAISSLNSMLNAWSMDNFIVHFLTRSNFTLTIGQSSYTLGSGGNFNAARPTGIHSAFLRDSGGSDHPIEIISRARYDAQSDKSSSGRPMYLYHNPTYPLSTVYLFPPPDSADTLYLNMQAKLVEITSQTQQLELTVPTEFEEALIYNLSFRLAPEYAVEPSDTVSDIAESALLAVKINNFAQRGDRLDEMSLDSGLPGGRGRRDYNIKGRY